MIFCDFFSIDDTSVFVISIAEAVITCVTSSAVVLSSEPSIIVNIVIAFVTVTVIVGFNEDDAIDSDDGGDFQPKLTWTRDPVLKHLIHLLVKVISIGFRVVREVNTHINSLNFVIYNIHTCVVNQLVIPVNYVSLNYGDFLRLPQKDINWFEKLTPAPPHRALPRARLCLW